MLPSRLEHFKNKLEKVKEWLTDLAVYYWDTQAPRDRISVFPLSTDEGEGRVMIFGEWSDSHDKRVEKIQERADERGEDISDHMLTNFNLVGIRRRLNNIEVGVWMIVILLVWHFW